MPYANQLLVIDPQNDFCDLPPDWWPSLPGHGVVQSSLPVPGAHADMQRLAQWMQRHGAQIDAITVTLDSHQFYDIAHPAFWSQGNGAPVPAFTQITAEQVRQGRYLPREAGALARCQAYLDALEHQGRYVHMVWPVHCELGSWGHGVHADVLTALQQWQSQRQRPVHNVLKGRNPWTEHYSALQAEVPDPEDADTALNMALLQRLDQAEQLVIAGQASSHCVRATVEHLLQYLPGGRPERLVLMQDAMSPVTGFESQHQAFLNAMRDRGVRLANSHDISL